MAKLQGSLTIPSSKSHTLRAILFGAMAHGRSHIKRYLPSPDTIAMVSAVRQLGAEVQITDDELVIHGGNLHASSDVIQCGNSGQVFRFLGALSGLFHSNTILTGDHSIQKIRPVQPLLDGLNQLGAIATSTGEAIMIKGPFKNHTATIDGEDSQPVSGLLIASAFAPHPIEIHVTSPGEKPWIDLTLDWLKRLGIAYERKDYSYYRLQGNARIAPFSYTVPGDFSTAAFPIAAALLTDSELTLHNLDMEDCQGDKRLIPLLEQMGARFSVEQTKIIVHRGITLKGMKIDINDCIDALPILAVIGCFAEGTTEIVGGAIARKKESDRISAIATELKKMGADIEEKPDGLVIRRSPLHGATLHTYNDHRIALALSIATLAASSPSTILNRECIQKTYPTFFEDFRKIGAQIG